jgi:hypothetical protein
MYCTYILFDNTFWISYETEKPNEVLKTKPNDNVHISYQTFSSISQQPQPLHCWMLSAAMKLYLQQQQNLLQNGFIVTRTVHILPSRLCTLYIQRTREEIEKSNFHFYLYFYYMVITVSMCVCSVCVNILTVFLKTVR